MGMSWIRRLPLLLAVVLMVACGAPEAETPAPAPTPEPTAEPAVEVYALVAPILEGQEDAWKDLVAEITGPRAEAHAQAYAKLGVTKENVWLQKAPEGSAAVVYMEGNDLENLMAREFASDDPHVQWFTEQLAAVHGFDPEAEPLPPNELVFEGDVSGVEGETQPYALAAPILKGQEAAFADFIAALQERRAEWEESRRAKGIAKEDVWLQNTPAGSIAVVYFEATEPEGLLGRMMAESDLPFDGWFQEQIAKIHGISGEPPPPNERLK
jgi:hypothetical protein